jgi:DNA-binding response OmpR family regulator
MDGQIAVASQLGEGTTFTVRLPVRHSAPAEGSGINKIAASPLALTTTPDPESASPPAGEAAGEVPQLLIVEDNRDVQHYLASCLRNEYELLFARNGREGITSALEYIPDLIISDVMMPEVDGFELCRTLKQDARTDHIPIVLLTAKADQAAKMEGLEYGADAYLIKPFHRRELAIRLQRLLELRRRLQAKYRQADFATEPKTEREDRFVQRVRQAVLDHLDDDRFDIETLSQSLHLHRSQLHRKLKALTGQSASRFVRRVRLQEAYRLLQRDTSSVKEAAYAVGFSSPSYFSRAFSEEFGVPPSQLGSRK